MASYDIMKPLNKERFRLEEGLLLHFVTATQAGFVAAFVANPFDVVKSRWVQHPAPVDTPHSRNPLRFFPFVDADAVPFGRVMNSTGKYAGMADCFSKTVAGEGVASLWKGFIPAWARVGPRVVIAFVTMEQLRARFG